LQFSHCTRNWARIGEVASVDVTGAVQVTRLRRDSATISAPPTGKMPPAAVPTSTRCARDHNLLAAICIFPLTLLGPTREDDFARAPVEASCRVACRTGSASTTFVQDSRFSLASHTCAPEFLGNDWASCRESGLFNGRIYCTAKAVFGCGFQINKNNADRGEQKRQQDSILVRGIGITEGSA